MMKKTFFMLIGISLFCSAYATGITQIAANDKGYGIYHDTGKDEHNPDKTLNYNTSNSDGIGNAGNTTGIGADHTNGNGPSN
ncbi:hypothetical protein [Legionella shakespearei]|nr:hypothetical protein [Legionella shakespearei]